jgi:hypothetical protein
VAPGAITFAKLATDAKPWTISGTTITPTDATKTIACAPITDALRWGSRTVKGHLSAAGTVDTAYFAANAALNAASSAWVQDDAAKPSWILTTDVGADQFVVGRLAPGGAYTNPMYIDATGKLNVPGPPASAADNATILMGSRTQKGRVQALPGLDWVGMTLNRRYNGTAWTRDDTAQPSWTYSMAADIRVSYETAAGVGSTPFIIGTDGKTYCTLGNSSVTMPMMAVGASLRVMTSVAMPGNFNSNNIINTWITVMTCPAFTTYGNYVLLLSNGALQYSGAGGVTVYLAFFRDGGQLNGSRYSCGASTGGILNMPLPSQSWWDAPPAGTHTYSLRCYVTTTAANITGPADNTGAMWAMEFS